MRVLGLDYPHLGDDAGFARFASATTCFEYDIVIWDPAASFEHYRYLVSYPNETYRGLPNLSEHASVTFTQDILRRRAEFKEFVESGKHLFVLGRPPQQCYCDTGRREHSGTGRNRQTTNIVNVSDVWDALPSSKLELQAAGGERIQFVGPAPLSPLWGQLRDLYFYEATLDWDGATPWANISGTQKAVGAFATSTNGGAIVLLPIPYFVDHQSAHHGDDDEPEGMEETTDGRGVDDDARDFHAAVEAVAAAFAPKAARAPQPEWAGGYRVSGESESRAAVLRHEERLAAARDDLAAAQADLDALNGRKSLFTGTGAGLEEQVRVVFEALGGRVDQSDGGRDDLTVQFPEGPVVVEVKGLGKSAGEKDAAQLEKWVSTHLEEHGELPKGVLVVNAWRGRGLDERTDPNFPDQMLSYSKSRNHCLVTGIQLLGILQDVEANPDRGAYWRDLILLTSGTLGVFADWREVVDLAEAEPGG